MKGLFSRGARAAFLACVLLTARAHAQTSIEIYAGGSPFVDVPANTVPIRPMTMALGTNGTLYVAEMGKILRFDPATNTVTSVPNLPGLLEYRFSQPSALVYGPGVLNLLANHEQWQLDLIDGPRTYLGYVGATRGATFAPDGTLYFSRFDEHAIYRRTLTGTISTLAGSTVSGFSGDGTTTALFNNPRGLAFDSAGNIYIADSGNNRIRRRAANGIITTIAGTGASNYNGDNLLATQTNLLNPLSLALDTAGNLYINEDGYRVRRLNAATGRITPFAGDGSLGGDPGNGGPAVNASLNGVTDIEVASNGTLYIAESDSYRVRKVDPVSGIISLVIGNGTTSFCGEGVPARAACLAYPNGITIDDAGDVYVSDQNNKRIRKISAATGLITTIAGGNWGAMLDGVPASSAVFPNGTLGITVDAARNLYFIGDNRVRRIDAASGIITTVAGNGSYGFSGDGGPAVAAQFNSASRLALDHSGNIYVSDTFNNRVRRVDAVTGIITTVAGTGLSTGPLGDDGPGTLASLGGPDSLAIDPAGNLLIGDTYHYRIRKLNPATGVITTAVGNGTNGMAGNGGPAIAASIGHRPPFAVDAGGNIYLASSYQLRRVDAQTGVIDQAPAPIWGLYTPEGRGLESPTEMVIGSDNRLYISDANNVVFRVSGLPTPASDLTPPVIEPIITGTLGNNDWYRSNVQISWSVTDPESPVTTTAGCAQSQVTWDTEGASFYCIASSEGGTTNRFILIKRDTVAPQLTFGTPSPAADPAGWNSSDVSVPFNASDATSGVYSTSSGSPVTITGSGSNLTGSVLVTDAAGNSATFTTPAVNIDRSPPEITPTMSGTLGSNGWYTSDVQVSWAVNAGASPVSSSAGCDTATVNTDTSGITFTCTATSAGGTASQSVTLKRDATLPQLEFGAPSPAPGAGGWFGGDVTFPFSAIDATSGVSSPGSSGSVVVAGTGTGLTSQVTVTDGAGNSATFTTPAVNIANTPPIVTAQISGTAGNNGWYRSNVQVAWTVAGGVLPITGSSGCGASNVTADTTGITFTCSATSAGGTTTQSVTVKRDATAPALAFGAKTPAPNSRGWNTTNVSVPFTASDVTSGVASTSSPSPVVISGNGAGLTASVTVTDQAGNSASFTTVAVNIDNTVAVITPNITGTLGNNGWYRSNVQLTWAVNELPGSIEWTSGCGTYNVTSDTTGISYSCGVQSTGGYTSKTVSIKRDATAPVITITRPANGATYTAGQSVTSSFSCADARMQSCTGTVANGAALDTSTPGTRTFTVDALDLAGNTTTQIRTYTVQ